MINHVVLAFRIALGQGFLNEKIRNATTLPRILTGSGSPEWRPDQRRPPNAATLDMAAGRACRRPGRAQPLAAPERLAAVAAARERREAVAGARERPEAAGAHERRELVVAARERPEVAAARERREAVAPGARERQAVEAEAHERSAASRARGWPKAEEPPALSRAD
jgi:hypothetical protein